MRRLVRRAAATKPGSWVFARVAHRLDRIVYRLHRRPLDRGLVGVGPAGGDGDDHRRAQRAREVTNPILGVPDGGGIVVIGSNFGQAHHPAWVHNLRADPRAQCGPGRRAEPRRGRRGGHRRRARPADRARERGLPGLPAVRPAGRSASHPRDPADTLLGYVQPQSLNRARVQRHRPLPDGLRHRRGAGHDHRHRARLVQRRHDRDLDRAGVRVRLHVHELAAAALGPGAERGRSRSRWPRTRSRSRSWSSSTTRSSC